MFHPKPAIYQLPEPELDMSWSENTTPDYDDIEEIIRTAPSRLSVPVESRIRIMREPIKKRRRIDEVPRGSWQGRVFHEFAQPLNVRCSMDGSDGSNSSALTIITSASSSVGDPWSASGHVEEEEEGGADWDRDGGEEGEGERDGEEEEESFVLPKIEPIDDDTVDMGDVKEASMPDSPEQPRQPKRPRGRPRKHPKPTPESLAKVAKGRSKTGCITCRRRKKKCDEAKPRCMNCEKNNVRCEGYPDRKIWQSGKEKAEEEGTISAKQYWPCQQDAEELIASTARMRRVSLPTIKLQSLIHGVDTDGDRLFFRHYIYRLSSIFTLEGERKNAFKDMILPLAIRNQGLMHSILALAGRHINYRSSYGVQLLKDHPTVKESELEERSDFHKQEAMKLFLSDCDRQQRGEDQGDDIVSARFGQMICMVMDTLSNPDPRGDHRLHLQAYQRLIKERPPADGEFLNFIREFFDYHISMDDLIFLPSPTALEFSIEATNEEDSFESLETEIPGPASGVRMLGVCDGLFHLMSHITKMRNTIRDNIRKGIDPPVVYSHLWKGAELDIAIRRWEPAMTPDHPSYPAALMYKQMAWVYLWRTIYPPIPGSSTPPNSKIKAAVDQGLEILKTFGPNDPSQTLLLGPIFMLGCASFEECQRKEVRKAISVVKTYMQYRNSDSALEVLEEMWRRMDRGDASSWDWQRVSRDMGRDFLAT